MNGATALDCDSTINSPNNTKTMTIGSSQYFFSWRRNVTKSDITLMTSSLLGVLDEIEDGLRDWRGRRRDATGAEVPPVEPRRVVVQVELLAQVDQPQPAARVAAVREAEHQREPIDLLRRRVGRREDDDDAASV